MNATGPEDRTSVDHPDICDYPSDEETWGMMWSFRNQSQETLVGVFLSGIVVFMVAYGFYLLSTGYWRGVIYLVEPTPANKEAALNAEIFATTVCVLYSVHLSRKGYGWPLWNFVLPLLWLMLGVSFMPVIFSQTNQSIVVGAEALPNIDARSRGLSAVPMVYIPLVFLQYVKWRVMNNPERARQWEREHLPAAMFSHWIEESDAEGIGDPKIAVAIALGVLSVVYLFATGRSLWLVSAHLLWIGGVIMVGGAILLRLYRGIVLALDKWRRRVRNT